MSKSDLPAMFKSAPEFHSELFLNAGMMNCTFTLNNYDEKQQKRVRVIYNDDSEWLWSSYLNRNIAREKK